MSLRRLPMYSSLHSAAVETLVRRLHTPSATHEFRTPQQSTARNGSWRRHLTERLSATSILDTSYLRSRSSFATTRITTTGSAPSHLEWRHLSVFPSCSTGTASPACPLEISQHSSLEAVFRSFSEVVKSEHTGA